MILSIPNVFLLGNLALKRPKRVIAPQKIKISVSMGAITLSLKILIVSFFFFSENCNSLSENKGK